MVFRTIADRIEAAYERELSKERPKNGADFGQFGNAAAMREALERVDKFLSVLGKWLKDNDEVGEYALAAGVIHTLVEHALSAPARNCDVGTAGEQSDRFTNLCDSRDCSQCPVMSLWDFANGHTASCGVLWAQMPYAEEGGANGK